MLADINEVKILRKRHSLTQNQLAKLAGVSQSLIAKLEAGLIDPSYSNFRRIYDVLQGLGEKKEAKAAEVASRRIISVAGNSALAEAVKKMKQHEISQLPVIEKGSVVGLVSEADVIESIHQGREVKGLKVADVMQDAPPTVPQATPLSAVTELLRVSQIIIVTDKGKAAGVITKADVLDRLTK
ncbi:CBS domain-containing protein [Candidatus Woesearchaeota archaeon]|nr:CBS domain-containing protein [Candidatus Woesearchaeota archaeon]